MLKGIEIRKKLTDIEGSQMSLKHLGACLRLQNDIILHILKAFDIPMHPSFIVD